MKKKSLNSLQDLSLAYSTNKDFVPSIDDNNELTSAKSSQKIRVQPYTKLKAGKSISRIYGFEESLQTLEDLCRHIKQKCGTGGSVKDGEIIIQGDKIDKIIAILIDQGYKNTKRSGG